jgi:hypothetical protein
MAPNYKWMGGLQFTNTKKNIKCFDVAKMQAATVMSEAELMHLEV